MSENEQPINGAPPSADELNAATQAYANAVVSELGGQLNIAQLYVQFRIAQVHFQALLDTVAATGFPMAALQVHFCELLKSEAERMSGPKLAIATSLGIPRKQ